MKALTNNLGWKLISLLMAVALWIAVAREPELSTALSVPIEFKGMPEDLDLGSNLPERANLEIRGPSSRIARDNLTDLAVVLDLSNASEGEHTYNIHASDINLPSGVSFHRALPSQITLRFDKLATREVEIVVAPYSKGPPDGYRVSSFTLEPSKARIRGPEERVKNIERVSINPVDLSGVISHDEFHTQVNVGDPQVKLEAPSAVTLRVTVERTSKSKKETK